MLFSWFCNFIFVFYNFQLLLVTRGKTRPTRKRTKTVLKAETKMNFASNLQCGRAEPTASASRAWERHETRRDETRRDEATTRRSSVRESAHSTESLRESAFVLEFTSLLHLLPCCAGALAVRSVGWGGSGGWAGFAVSAEMRPVRRR